MLLDQFLSVIMLIFDYQDYKIKINYFTPRPITWIEEDSSVKLKKRNLFHGNY